MRAGQDGERSRAPHTDLRRRPKRDPHVSLSRACLCPSSWPHHPESSIHPDTHLGGVPLTCGNKPRVCFPPFTRKHTWVESPLRSQHGPRPWGDGRAHSIKSLPSGGCQPSGNRADNTHHGPSRYLGLCSLDPLLQNSEGGAGITAKETEVPG